MAIKIDPIKVPTREAKRRAAEYTAANENKSTALVTTANKTINGAALTQIDKGLHETYLAMAEGKTVLDIRQVFRDAGQDTNLRPKIAFARADWRGTQLTRMRDGTLIFADPTSPPKDSYTPAPKRYQVPQALPPMKNADFMAGSMVPTIPPKIRPDSLEAFCIIWEVSDWKGLPKPVPSRFSIFREQFSEYVTARMEAMKNVNLDPILLRPLGGPLYVVVAAWDMTPLEATLIGAL
jgi:hypothetical protein